MLPLSYLHFSLSFSYHAIKNHIYSLNHSLITSHMCFKSQSCGQESRANALSLLRRKFLHFLPSYLLSLVVAITTINSAYSTVNNRCFTLQTAITSAKPTWKRLLVTTVCIYAFLLFILPAIFCDAIF